MEENRQGFRRPSFGQVLPKGEIPHTRHVRGSNFVLMGVFEDRLPGRAIIICVIDNLVKVQTISHPVNRRRTLLPAAHSLTFALAPRCSYC
jgi:hypothetical protein